MSLELSKVAKQTKEKGFEIASSNEEEMCKSKEVSTFRQSMPWKLWLSASVFMKIGMGEIEDSMDFVQWANDYQHYVAIRNDIESTWGMLLDLGHLMGSMLDSYSF